MTSRDDRARAGGSRGPSCGSLALAKIAVWVNPDMPKEEPIDWLRGGAKPERSRTLAHYAPTSVRIP